MVFFAAKNVTVLGSILAISSSIFFQFAHFLSESYLTIITHKFLLADVRNQRKVRLNATAADDALMQQSNIVPRLMVHARRQQC